MRIADPGHCKRVRSSQGLRVLGGALGLLVACVVQAAQVVINGPAGSGQFGAAVHVLPNGHFVVVDTSYDAAGPVADVGAVRHYRADGSLLATLVGASSGDRIGSAGIVVLASGNYVVLSPLVSIAGAASAGAATFASGTTGLSGMVSAANSLVGSSADDRVGLAAFALDNGDYAVSSINWRNGVFPVAGAITFASGTSGIAGPVSAANSLVGPSSGDRIGLGGVLELGGGRYLVPSYRWNNDAGAVTFLPDRSAAIGTVSAANSLVGSTMSDEVGRVLPIVLDSGDYVVPSPLWDQGATADVGAVTFGSGTAGVSGPVSSANSLVGSTAGDNVGSAPVLGLSGNRYVVRSPGWNNGAIADAGAATFAAGVITGPVTPVNSLVGTTADDLVGFGITVLANGNYVIQSPLWDDGAVPNVGATTFASGISGISGLVTPANSLVGSSASDNTGFNVIALTNGNYVVLSSFWDNGPTADVGAATFASGTSGRTGAVSPANSLIGTQSGDRVGGGGLALANGNYVVRSQNWRSGAFANAGAATFGSGSAGIAGVVSPSNSLVGTSVGDLVGVLTALDSGDYLVTSASWDNGASANAGIVAFASGTTGAAGSITVADALIGTANGDNVGFNVLAAPGGRYIVVSPERDRALIADAGAVTLGPPASAGLVTVSSANSLVGSTADDEVGSGGVFVQPNGNYVVRSPRWDNGATADAGAITLGLADGSVIGSITNTHSVLGTVASGGSGMQFAYDPERNQLVVGQTPANRVVLHRTGAATAISIVGEAPDPSGAGQPVMYSATLSVPPAAPVNGRVTFRAGSGETCVDDTPAMTSSTTADFACAVVFGMSGTTSVIAEFTGSLTLAYSGSFPEPHTVVADPIFANGFE